MFSKVYKIADIRIVPERVDGDGNSVPTTLFFSYRTEVLEDGVVFGRSEIHRGSAPLSNLDDPVPISNDGTTKTPRDILGDAGLLAEVDI